MADICIVYAREDEKVAENLHKLLSQQWDVWWDNLIIGEYPKAIESAILNTRCVVPIFSEHSKEKSTVRDELNYARKYCKPIVAISIDNSDPPYSFGDLSRTNFFGWDGDVRHLGVKQLLTRLTLVTPPKEKPKRLFYIAKIGLPLPTVFLSVSSHDTQLAPQDAVKMLHLYGTPAILVSAYDLIAPRKPKSLTYQLKRYQKTGGFILVDSGNYEASRLGDSSWSHGDLKSALKNAPHDLAFCFDVMRASSNADKGAKQVVTAVRRDQAYTAAPVLPIVHAPRDAKYGYALAELPNVVRKVSEELKPLLIAIPERELGAGLIERARTVRAIRTELNRLAYYQPIHLLGTGNPWSIAVLAAAGADTFDGLEWCRYSFDLEREQINHFHHFDLLVTQNSNPALLSVLDDDSIEFAAKAALHNLEYYREFSKHMHNMFSDNSIEAFVGGIIPKKAFKKLKEEIPDLFK